VNDFTLSRDDINSLTHAEWSEFADVTARTYVRDHGNQHATDLDSGEWAVDTGSVRPLGDNDTALNNRDTERERTERIPTCVFELATQPALALGDMFGLSGNGREWSPVRFGRGV